MANEIKEPLVYIVDDDEEVRSAVQLLMESVGLRVQPFESANAFLEDFDPEMPGCILLDIRMPGMNGLDLQELLVKRNVFTPVIIISGHGDIPMAVRAVKAGALDFIEKPFNDQFLLDSVHRALELDEKKRGIASEQAEIRARYESLTQRERDVLEQVINGKRNKVIADVLSISQSTVEAHRAKVMEKMQANSLSALMRMVLSLEKD